jgi:hypothetical protein
VATAQETAQGHQAVPGRGTKCEVFKKKPLGKGLTQARAVRRKEGAVLQIQIKYPEASSIRKPPQVICHFPLVPDECDQDPV